MDKAKLKLLRKKISEPPEIKYFDITALGIEETFDYEYRRPWLTKDSVDNCVRSLMYLWLKKRDMLDISDEDLMQLLKENGLDTEYAIALFVAQDLDEAGGTNV